jgi:anti-sigma-K factor RskA
MTPPDDEILDLLAAYALDALGPDEIAQVSSLLDERPELRTTVAELRATANQLPYGLPEANPAPELRQRVLDYATGRAPTRARAGPAQLAGRARVWLLTLGGLAAAAMLVAVLGWAQLAAARTELAQAQQQLVAARAELLETREQLSAIQATAQAAEPIRWKSDTGQATLFRDSAGEAVLVAQLPPLQPGRVYQLWRIQGQGTPASVGIFTVDQQGFGALALPPEHQPRSGDTFAVTDEPDGGSPGPTTEVLIAGTLPTA